MAEILNLRRVRRAAQRQREAEMAAANRARHGTPRLDRLRAQTENEAAERRLDGARLQGEPELSD